MKNKNVTFLKINIMLKKKNGNLKSQQKEQKENLDKNKKEFIQTQEM